MLLMGMAADHESMGLSVVILLQVELLALIILGFHGSHWSAMAQVQGFVSIDCGANDWNYADKQNISWTSDSNMISVGDTATVQPPSGNATTGNVVRPYRTIRYFPGKIQTKYCYVLPTLTSRNYYLVRASFWIGSSTPPGYQTRFNYEINFTLLINSDEWANVSISLPQLQVVVHEINLQTNSSNISVCLSGASTGTDPPFISSLELRPLNEAMYLVQCMSQTGLAMRTISRLNYGALSDAAFRYPDDFADRIWLPETRTPRLSTDQYINTTGMPDQPPLAVMQTAYVTSSPTTPLDVNLSVDNTHGHSYFYLLYLAEIDPLVNASGQRVFDIAVNGQLKQSGFDLLNLAGLRHYVGAEIQPSPPISASGPYEDFRFSPTATSQYPPFLNALELFQLLDKPLSLAGTSALDIFAIDNITATFVSLSSYTGDPCLPPSYAYPWLKCDSTATPPRINVLSLSNYGLVGAIPQSMDQLTGLVNISLDGNKLEGSIPDLSALTSLQILNLGGNRLSGAIPSFISTLPNLSYLFLENNNLSGPIPTELLQRKNFHFNYSGNPFLCIPSKGSCVELVSHKTSHIGLIIGLVISSLLVLIGAISISLYCLRMRCANLHQLECGMQHNELVEASNMITVFSYREIQLATNDFSQRLGDGGFGPVYRGKLENGRPVAIKVLSGDSRQGSREFLNEVSLLSRVRHKNVVGLLGYCTDPKLILVYEYMSNGSLGNLLYGGGSSIAPLSWGTRLKIMVDAAQGLEYLHHGCNPPIIHRDVKSNNILLSDNMEAKIGDFGISRVQYDTDELATSLMGSLGYLDPEYGTTLKLTEKADVYGFGVLLFEAICGRPPFNQNNLSEDVHITRWVLPSIERGMIEEIVDKAIHNDYDIASMWKVIELAMNCVQVEGKRRPTMNEVCIELREALLMELKGSSSGTHETTHLHEEVKPR